MKKNYPVFDNANIKTELQKSYLNYAVNIIIKRALPDIRDGLKPVHRRILYAMHKLNNHWNFSYKKSARIVGDVIGKYHPHGDLPVYEAIIKMTQSFSIRYNLIHGQGNFGSIDGDPAAAMRYTEIKMARITKFFFDDLDKNIVEYVFNYDNSIRVPVILPSKIPILLINGSSGIAVGMITNIPSHNLFEVMNGCLAMIHNNTISVIELMKYITGPDFPTAASINGISGIFSSYNTGHGKIYIRSNVKVMKIDNSKFIIIKDIPYQVNKIMLLKKISDLVNEKKIEGILNLKDESNKNNIWISLEINSEINSKIILNQLYSLTGLELIFNINMTALYNNKTKVFNLKEIIYEFISFRYDIILKRTKLGLLKLYNKIHIIEGIYIALENIDKIIKTIRCSHSIKYLRYQLCKEIWDMSFYTNIAQDYVNITKYSSLFYFGNIKTHYSFSIVQANIILDLKLNYLSSLCKQDIIDNLKICLKNAVVYKNIAQNPGKIINIIKDDCIDIKKKFHDKRRTIITKLHKNLF